MERKIEKALIPDLFSFIKKPTYQEKVLQKPFGSKLWSSIRIWSLQLLFVFLIAWLAETVLGAVGYEGENLIGAASEDASMWVFFILVCIQAPLLEEVAFRGWLKVSRVNLSLSIPLILSFLLSISLNFLFGFGLLEPLQNWFENLSWYFSLMFDFLPIIGIFLLNYFVIFKSETNLQKAHKFTRKYFKPLFWISAVLFGFAHIGNNTELESIWFLIPLLALPQFVAGLGLGYVRVKFGLWWSIFVHFINNLLPFIIFWILSFMSAEGRWILENGNTEEIAGKDASMMILIGLFGIFIAILNIAINIYNLADTISYFSFKKQQKQKK